MPYIRNYQRDKYYKWIAAIVEELPFDLPGLDGHLNHFISQLVVELIYGKHGGKKVDYHKRKVLIHTMYAAADELRRKHLDPYEDEKIAQNGDIVYENLVNKYRQQEIPELGTRQITDALPE